MDASSAVVTGTHVVPAHLRFALPDAGGPEPMSHISHIVSATPVASVNAQQPPESMLPSPAASIVSTTLPVTASALAAPLALGHQHAPSSESKETVPNASPALRILVADDDHFNQKLLQKLLQRDDARHEVVIAANGALALDSFLSRVAPSSSPGAMAGSMAAVPTGGAPGRLTSTSPAPGRISPVVLPAHTSIAFTASAFRPVVSRAASASASSGVVSTLSPSPVTPSGTVSPSLYPNPGTISPSISTLSASSVPSAPPFDLIFMDLEMPVMSGFAVIEKIRDWEAAHSAVAPVPIIVMSAHDGAAFTSQCERFRVRQFVRKPLQGKQLTMALRNCKTALGRAAAAGPGDPAADRSAS